MATGHPDAPSGLAGRLAGPVESSLEAVLAWIESVQEFCAARGIPGEAAFQTALVFEEILTNIVLHGPGGDAHIEAALEATGPELRGEVSDSGPPFDPLQAPPPDLEASLEDRPIGGLGIHLVRTLTDETSYERSQERNRLRFVKRLAASGDGKA